MSTTPNIPELYQTEWCPSCRRVRQALTERGIDVVLRQVPAMPEDRDALRERTGARSVPTLVLPDGTSMSETDAIVEWIEQHAAGAADAAYVEGHRAKARRVRERELQQQQTGASS